MDNLEQRRAKNALAKAHDCQKSPGEGDCLSGYPGLIINNGLLACLAFSLEKATKKDGTRDANSQWGHIADAIAYQLHEMEICQRLGGGQVDAVWLLQYLSGRVNGPRNQPATAHTLRRATDEALAFLGYLKRFVKTPLASALP